MGPFFSEKQVHFSARTPAPVAGRKKAFPAHSPKRTFLPEFIVYSLLFSFYNGNKEKKEVFP